MRNKTLIFSKVYRFVLLIAAGILLSIALFSYGVPKPIVFILIIVLYLAFTVLSPMYIIYKSKSIKSIDRYVSLNNKRPIFSYSYALGHGNNEDIENALKRVMNTYGQDNMHPIYGANLAIHQNKPQEVLDFVEKMSGSDYKNYYSSFAYILRGNFEKADSFLKQVHTPWMVHSLKAVIAKEQNDYEGFRSEANKSIASAIGMQRYILHHMMRRFENESFSDSNLKVQ